MLFDKITFFLCTSAIGWMAFGDNWKKFVTYCALVGIGSSAYRHWILP